MKKIGILAYHRAMNFGANLQIFSTYNYLKNNGYTPIIIDWVAPDLESFYSSSISENQIKVHTDFINKMMMSSKCHNAEDIARVIENENIDAVIIGSDAVAQHHTVLDNIAFPSKHILSIIKRTSDTLFPNPFWGTFLECSKKQVPLAFLSASSQNSDFKNFSKTMMAEMNQLLKKHFVYVSTRDKWTSDMFAHITNNSLIPEVTPDPVFAYNYNLPDEMKISKEEILKKYNLPENYVLVSFLNNRNTNRDWCKRLENLFQTKGYECVALTFPSGIHFDHPFNKVVDAPLPPNDWYHIIKYSKAYIGHNMHPIVVSLHNSVPFFSFDTYGVSHFKLYVETESSKIFHILKTAGFEDYRMEARSILKKRPTPEYVFDKIINFDKNKCVAFANNYYSKYLTMMHQICSNFELYGHNR